MEDNVTFKSISDFKTMYGAHTLLVVTNAKSNKISVLVNNEKFLRCQQNIDTSKPMSFLIPNGELDNACLVNTGSPLTVMVEL